MFTKYLFFFLFIFSSQLLQAQNLLFKNYTTADGLSSSEVYDITQDKNGYIWFATDRGITRFDGYEFKRYTLKDGLEDLVVLNFYEQKDGTILCSSYNKRLFYINPDKETFFPYKYNDLLKNSTGSKFISNLSEGDDNALIISFNYFLGYSEISEIGGIENYIYPCDGNTGCIQFQNDQPFLVNRSNKNERDNLFFNSIIDSISNACSAYIENLDSDRFLLINNENFYVIDHREESSTYITNNKTVAISGNYDENHFWVGLKHGGGKIFSNEGKLKHHFLENNSVTKILKDHEGGLWISTTDSGVYYLKNLEIQTHTISENSEEAFSLTKNNTDQLYVGYGRGELYKRQNHNFEKILQSDNNTPVRVQYNQKTDRLLIQTDKLYEERANQIVTLHLGGYGRVLSDNQNKFPLTKNRILYQDNDDYFIPPKKELGVVVIDIDYAEDGYYVGALSGLYQYKNDSLLDLRSSNSLFSSRINDIDQVGDRYYFASLGQGVLIKDQDSVFSINTSDGLSSNLATEIYIENSREIYVATNTGVNKIAYDKDFEKYTISNITTLDGLPCNQINDIEIISDTLWVASKKGLHSFPKTLFESKNQLIEKDWLQIKDIQVNNNNIENFKNLEALKHDQNTVEISFNAISFKKSKNIFFRYRLLGLESDWNTTQNRSVKYADLASGEYIFEIQTKGGNDSWNLSSNKTKIAIAYPFWETWWFYSVLTLLLALTIYSFFKFKILLYNKDVFRELMIFMLKKVSGKKYYVIIKESGVEIKLNTSNIFYAKSAGNYLEIYTIEKVYVVRIKIGDFEKSLPDTHNFLRVHRSYLVRKDKIDQKNSKWVQIKDHKIPVSKINKDKIEEMVFY